MIIRSARGQQRLTQARFVLFRILSAVSNQSLAAGAYSIIYSCMVTVQLSKIRLIMPEKENVQKISENSGLREIKILKLRQ